MANYDSKLRKVFELVEAQYQYLKTHPEPHKSALFEDLAGCGRDFANMIHDLPNDWSGKASQKAVANKLSNVKFRHSEDHFHSRQRGGELLVNLILTHHHKGHKPKMRDVKKIIDQFCQVHYVTKEENYILKHIMEPGKTWQAAYKEAGIPLADARDLFGKRGRHSEVWKEEMEAKFKPFLKLKAKK